MDLDSLKFRIINRFDFSNLEEYTLLYRLRPDVAHENPIHPVDFLKAVEYFDDKVPISLAPHDTGYFELSAVVLDSIKDLDTIAPGRDVMVDFYLVGSNTDFTDNTDLLSKVVAYEQFKLPLPTTKKNVPNLGFINDTIESRRVDSLLIVTIGKTEVVFNSKIGRITTIKKDGKPVVVDGPQLNFWRPPTDNDHVDGHGELLWRRIGLDNLTWTVKRFNVDKYWGDDLYVNIERIALNENGETVFSTLEEYMFKCSGDILIYYAVFPSKWVPSLPKFGVQMKVSDELVNTEWVGNAQETYPDRQTCGFVGHYEAPTDDLFHHYVYPQAAGNRMETRYVSMLNKERQRMFSATIPDWWLNERRNLQFSIYPYSDENIGQAKHTNELRKENYYTLNIDYLQAGIGTATCGPGIADRDLVETSRMMSFDLLLQVGENAFFEDLFVDKSKYFLYFHPDVNFRVSRKTGDFDPVTLLSKPDAPYDKHADSVLIDEYIGNPANYREGWVGYFGKPMELRLETLPLNGDSLTVTLSFAHHPSQWVFMPQKVLVSYSKNGKKYSKPEEVALPFDPTLEANSKPRVCILRHKIPSKEAKYIRIEAEPVEKLPEWHAAAGEKAWIMTDEIRVGW